jgi:hypothetical protein
MKGTYVQRASIKEQTAGRELIVFDEGSDCVHVLNGSAAFVWKCLKSPRTPDQIESALREEYDMSTVPDVPGMIRRVLDDFSRKSLIDIQ